MKMDRGLDTGDILLRCETEIGKDETSPELMGRLAFDGAELLSETLSKINEVEPIEQNHDEATLAPIMSKNDGIIDWNSTANHIANRGAWFSTFPQEFYKL